MTFRSVPYDSLSLNPFTKIGKEWALLTAGDENGFNTMTVSWGAMGFMWGKPSVTVYIRPQRYTKEFVDTRDTFTLSFYPAEKKDALSYLGKVSGRDEDKVKKVGFQNDPHYIKTRADPRRNRRRTLVPEQGLPRNVHRRSHRCARQRIIKSTKPPHTEKISVCGGFLISILFLNAFTEAILNLRHAHHLLYAKRTALRPISRYQIVFLRVFLAILQGLCYHVSYKFKKGGTPHDVCLHKKIRKAHPGGHVPAESTVRVCLCKIKNSEVFPVSDKLQKSPLAVVFNIVLAVALVLFIISAAVVFTLNFRPLYYFDVDHLNITAMSGLPREEILQNYNVLIDYNSIFGTKVLNFPTLAMSESGRIHFEEVKNVFGVFEITLIVSGILSLAGIIYRHFKKNPGYLLLSGILTVAIPAALGVLIALNWETVFILFHKIVFHNNYWIFDAATDPVITILPDTFFMHCALMILALVVLGSIICLLAYRHAKHKKTHIA